MYPLLSNSWRLPILVKTNWGTSEIASKKQNQKKSFKIYFKAYFQSIIFSYLFWVTIFSFYSIKSGSTTKLSWIITVPPVCFCFMNSFFVVISAGKWLCTLVWLTIFPSRVTSLDLQPNFLRPVQSQCVFVPRVLSLL